MQKYAILMRINHWVMGTLIIGMLMAGVYMTSAEMSDSARMSIYGIHKSFGLIALGYFVFRLSVRMLVPVPAIPDAISPLERKLAKLGHFMLYAFMIIMPLSGFTMSMLSGYGIKFFGTDIPLFLPINYAIAGIAHMVHGVVAYIFMAVIIVHALAPLKHYCFDKVNIIKRII